MSQRLRDALDIVYEELEDLNLRRYDADIKEAAIAAGVDHTRDVPWMLKTLAAERDALKTAFLQVLRTLATDEHMGDVRNTEEIYAWPALAGFTSYQEYRTWRRGADGSLYHEESPSKHWMHMVRLLDLEHLAPDWDEFVGYEIEDRAYELHDHLVGRHGMEPNPDMDYEDLLDIHDHEHTFAGS